MSQQQTSTAQSGAQPAAARPVWVYQVWFAVGVWGHGAATVAHHDLEAACKCVRFHLAARGMAEAPEAVRIAVAHTKHVPGDHSIPAGEVLIEVLSPWAQNEGKST